MWPTLRSRTSRGSSVSLCGFAGKKAVVLAFLGTDCPVGNLYAPRLAELSKAYQDKGVVFLGINSNAQETVEQVAAHAKTFGLEFPVLKDPVNLVADLTLAERTCEVLVLDGRANLRYRGAIDDQYAIGKRKPAAGGGSPVPSRGGSTRCSREAGCDSFHRGGRVLARPARAEAGEAE